MKYIIQSLRLEHIRSYDEDICEYFDNKLYILNCCSENGEKYEVRLWTEYSVTGCSICVTYGHGELIKVDSFVGMTHKPIRKLIFELNEKDMENEVEISDMENEIFSVSHDDECGYYPSGDITLNEDLFKATIRNKEKRPVWIFKGDSALGKSYLAGIIANSGRMKLVYETDAHEKLEDIDADIIVVGNKYQYSIEEIEQKIKGEHETIVVDFSKITA